MGKVVDFGLAQRFRTSPMIEEVGTLCYMAPEVLLGSYSEKVDLWSLGIMAFGLLCGHSPWPNDDDAMRAQIKRGEPDLNAPHFKALSPEAQDFVMGLLCGEAQRLSASQALKH